MNTEQSCANCTKGHRYLGNIHRPNMNMVYVNGMENRDIRISEMERLSKNFQISDDILSPLNSTIIVMILLANDTAAVVEYSIMRKTCHLLDSASSDGRLSSDVLLPLLAIPDNQIGSIARQLVLNNSQEFNYRTQ